MKTRNVPKNYYKRPAITNCFFFFSLPFPALMVDQANILWPVYYPRTGRQLFVGVAEPLAHIPDFKNLFLVVLVVVGLALCAMMPFNSDFANWAFKNTHETK